MLMKYEFAWKMEHLSENHESTKKKGSGAIKGFWNKIKTFGGETRGSDS